MEIKVKGKLKTEEQLRDEVIDKLIEALEGLDEDAALDLGNAYRSSDYTDPLYVNDENTINDELRGVDAYTILQMAENWNENDQYFSGSAYGDFGTTDDVWENVDLEDLATDLLEGAYSRLVLQLLVFQCVDRYRADLLFHIRYCEHNRHIE